MKIFIDLTGQILENEKQFAFYCSVSEKFEMFYASQTWNSIEEFIIDYKMDCGNQLERYLSLIPDNFF